ncbi:MAG TPA: AMP-binding protein, partial [Burkholderiales bacterium]|nr:AMP-binding protein [Burkholderiales bacterium]
MKTLPDLFRERVAATPQGEAYRQYDRAAGTWARFTWEEIGRRVERWKRALGGEGVAPGATIAILARNGVEHVCMDQAALALGCVPVPLHAIDNPESIAYILADSGAALLLVESAKRWAALAPMRGRFPGLKKILCLERPAPGDAVWIGDWLERGDRTTGTPPSRAVEPDALAAIVYTSGTTGRPKGCMLTHANLMSTTVGGGAWAHTSSELVVL